MDALTAKLRDDLLVEIERGAGECLELLRAFKEAGGEQRAAYDILESMRSAAREADLGEREDLIMDLMDVVCGWTQRHNLIWPETLKS